MKKLMMGILAGLTFSAPAFAVEKTALRVGVQLTGTLEWELSTLPESANYSITLQKFPTEKEAKAALAADHVDMIVSDWLWVAQARSGGADYTFYPYSSTSGALMVPAKSAIHDVKDLVGKNLGISGNESDKNWLLLQAAGKQQKVDLNADAKKTFGEPALISEQLQAGKFDAVLTYWHFAAQLEAQGYRQVFNGKNLQQNLGLKENVPTLGYVFKKSWADKYKSAVNSFFKDTKEAKNELCGNEVAWKKATAKLVNQPATVRQRYCDGRVQNWTTASYGTAEQLYSVLNTLNRNIASSSKIAAGTFWIVE